jgi:DnaK suppressor protein
MLTHSKKTEFRKFLEQHLEILSQSSNRSYSTHDFNDEYSDPLDRASAELFASQGFRFKERDSNLIRKIREALERLEDGTFGICDECGKAISEKRLQVRPIATRCIKCKEEQEKRERLFGT